MPYNNLARIILEEYYKLISESKGKLPSTISKIGKPVRIPTPRLPTIRPGLLNLGKTSKIGQTGHVPDDVGAPLEGEFTYRPYDLEAAPVKELTPAVGAPHVEPHGQNVQYLGVREAPGEPVDYSALRTELGGMLAPHFRKEPVNPQNYSRVAMPGDEGNLTVRPSYEQFEELAPSGLRDVIKSITADVRAGVITPHDAASFVIEYYPREAMQWHTRRGYLADVEKAVKAKIKSIDLYPSAEKVALEKLRLKAAEAFEANRPVGVASTGRLDLSGGSTMEILAQEKAVIDSIAPSLARQYYGKDYGNLTPGERATVQGISKNTLDSIKNTPPAQLRKNIANLEARQGQQNPWEKAGVSKKLWDEDVAARWGQLIDEVHPMVVDYYVDGIRSGKITGRALQLARGTWMKDPFYRAIVNKLEEPSLIITDHTKEPAMTVRRDFSEDPRGVTVVEPTKTHEDYAPGMSLEDFKGVEAPSNSELAWARHRAHTQRGHEDTGQLIPGRTYGIQAYERAVSEIGRLGMPLTPGEIRELATNSPTALRVYRDILNLGWDEHIAPGLRTPRVRVPERGFDWDTHLQDVEREIQRFGYSRSAADVWGENPRGGLTVVDETPPRRRGRMTEFDEAKKIVQKEYQKLLLEIKK